MSNLPASELPLNERLQQTHPAASREPVYRTHAGCDHHPARHMQRDSISALFWAAILIMSGLIFLADNLNMLPALNRAGVWDWIMLGAGTLLILEAVVRSLIPEIRGPELFWVIVGMVLMGLGAAAVFAINISWEQWWPAILIVIGISSLARAVRR